MRRDKAMPCLYLFMTVYTMQKNRLKTKTVSVYFKNLIF
jgi:hypothetical protein